MSVRAVTASAVRERASAEEWAARVDLAAAHRLLSHYGVDDLTYNHLSVRVPGEPDHLLIKAADMMFGEITASSLQKYELDGKPLTPGVTKTLYGGGLVIHAGILKARPDVNVVFHTHTPANMGVATQKHGLLPINQHAVRFYNRIAYHDFGGYEFNLAQREPLIRSLGNYKIALLRNHGSLVCDTTIAARVRRASLSGDGLQGPDRGARAAGRRSSCRRRRCASSPRVRWRSAPISPAPRTGPPACASPTSSTRRSATDQPGIAATPSASRNTVQPVADDGVWPAPGTRWSQLPAGWSPVSSLRTPSST